MGGWSGGVYTRFRNWVTDKANSVNPQAALFDQEDDGFAAGLNNCITKDGLNKPASAMDWNGQSLTGVLNFANTGTVSLVSGKMTINLTGNISIATPTSGIPLAIAQLTGQAALSLTGAAGISALMTCSGNGNVALTSDCSFGQDASGNGVIVQRANLPILTYTNSVQRTQVNTSNGTSFQANDDAGTLQTVGWRDCPVNSQGSNYTLALSDRGKDIFMTGNGSTLTIPANASVAFPVGTTIMITTSGSATISLAITTDSLFLAGPGTTGTRTINPFSLVTLTKISATQWFVGGTGIS